MGKFNSGFNSSYNPEPEVDDAESKRLAWEKKRNCRIEGCPLPGTVNSSSLCDDDTLFYCSYHDLFPGSDVAETVTNVLNNHARMLKIQSAAMKINSHEFDTLQADHKWKLGENIKPVTGETYQQWRQRITYSVRVALKSKVSDAVKKHRARAGSYHSGGDGVSDAVRALTDGSLLHNQTL